MCPWLLSSQPGHEAAAEQRVPRGCQGAPVAFPSGMIPVKHWPSCAHRRPRVLTGEKQHQQHLPVVGQSKPAAQQSSVRGWSLKFYRLWDSFGIPLQGMHSTFTLLALITEEIHMSYTQAMVYPEKIIFKNRLQSPEWT